MSESVAKRAVREAREVSRLAVDAAKSEIIEQLAPAIKQIVDAKLRNGGVREDIDRLRRAADGHGETEFEEGVEMKDKDDKKEESVAALFPNITEMEEGAYEVDEADEPDLGGEVAEAEEPAVDEEIEMSEADLAAMYESAMQLEVDVSKGFKDMAEPHDLGAGAKAQYQSDPANVETLKSGEHQWDDEVPPAAKKDWIPESLSPQTKSLIKRGLAENKRLVGENKKLVEMVRKMHGKLSEMNLLNSKILHVNRFLIAHKLNTEQKRSVIESIDKGKSVNEVKRIFSVLESSFKAAGAVTETRKPHADAQKRRTSGSPDTKVLRESVDKQAGGEGARWQELAGLLSGRKR